MSFKLQLISIVLFAVLNIGCYILTFPSDFALKNKNIYDIISIFNDAIFFLCFLSAVSHFRKARLKRAILFLSVPLIYTITLFIFFR